MVRIVCVMVWIELWSVCVVTGGKVVVHALRMVWLQAVTEGECAVRACERGAVRCARSACERRRRRRRRARAVRGSVACSARRGRPHRSVELMPAMPGPRLSRAA